MIEITEPILVISAMCITLAMLSLMSLIERRFTILGRLRLIMPIVGIICFIKLFPALKYLYSESFAMWCMIAITITIALITYFTLVFEDKEIKKEVQDYETRWL